MNWEDVNNSEQCLFAWNNKSKFDSEGLFEVLNIYFDENC